MHSRGESVQERACAVRRTPHGFDVEMLTPGRARTKRAAGEPDLDTSLVIMLIVFSRGTLMGKQEPFDAFEESNGICLRPVAMHRLHRQRHGVQQESSGHRYGR
jgi:hypothetical protein